MSEPKIIKALTLWEPWASAMAYGVKTIETRSWETKYRGWLAIHAAKRPIRHGTNEHELLERIKKGQALGSKHFDVSPGSVVAIVYLDEIRRINTYLQIRIERGYFGSATLYDLYLGDYSNGRYAWFTKQLIKPISPIPAKGKQGIWNWEVPEHITLPSI